VLSRERRLNVDFLDGLAIGLSILHTQFGTAALIAWLVNLGDAIRDRTAMRARRSVSDKLDFRLQRCWLLRRGRIVRAAIDEVREGDRVVVYAGGLIPVDGKVLRGSASVDQRSITGESLPAEKEAGAAVFAGTTVREGELHIEARQVGSDTTVARIVGAVENAPVGETRMQNYAEEFADRLVAPTVVLAGGLYAMSGDAQRLTSMAIVDYGTGIRVAAPTAILACIASGANRGIVFKSGSGIERLAKAAIVVFDKTGTVTRGEPRITRVVSYGRRWPERQIVGFAAAAEQRLRHPVAEALVSHARALGIRLREPAESSFRVGRGVDARIGTKRVQVGNERFLREHGIDLERARADVDELDRRGESRLLVGVDGELAGIITYADEVRPEMPEVLAALHSRGVRKVVMLTGDNDRVARAVSQELGFDFFLADVLPEEKARVVAGLRGEGVVVMVGDGVNDSPALARADVGIAVASGADISRETAGVVLMENNLRRLIDAFDIAEEAMQLIHQDYWIIAALNTLALLLSLPRGVASSGTIAAISNGSAILASLNSIRPVLRASRSSRS
jgi:Cu2+-exporting ATPase